MMNLAEPAGPHRQFFEPRRQRGDGRQDLVRQQVDKLLERLQRIGVRYQVDGRGRDRRGSAPESGGLSDARVLILDAAGLRDFRLWEIAWDEVPDGEVKLVFARELAQESLPGPNA